MNAAWRSYWVVLGGLLLLAAGLTAWLMLTTPVSSNASAVAASVERRPAMAAAAQIGVAQAGVARVHAVADDGAVSGRPDPIAAAGFMRGPSGALLPRFMTLAQKGAQVRLGPGAHYPVAWIIRTGGMPLEVLAEAGEWRRVRDHEGEEGWLHARALRADQRSALVAPWRPGARVALRAGRAVGAPLRAWLTGGVAVRLLACDGQWCQVQVKGVRGWLEQAQLWGIYRHERIRAADG